MTDPVHTSDYPTRTSAYADLERILDERKQAGWVAVGGPSFATFNGKTVLTHRFVRSN